MPERPSRAIRRPDAPRDHSGGVQRFARVVLAVVAGLAVLTSGPAPAAASQGQPPVVTGDAADPAIVLEGDQFRVYTTNHGYGNVPVWSGTRLDQLRFTGDALPTLGSWARPGFTWAPAVAQRGDGSWVLYYTARDRRSDLQCIGRAVSPSSTGPYRDTWSTPLICQTDRGGSIDPSHFVDPTTNTRYLLWKSDDNAIGRPTHLWSQELGPGDTGLTGSPRTVLSQSAAWESPLIEQPEMVHAGGRYWLLYSGNWWASASYATGYASCTGPAGPCTKVTSARPWHSSTAHAAGPGAAAFTADAQGRAWMVHHGWSGGVGYPSASRALFASRVTFAPSGPRVHADVPVAFANSSRAFYDVAAGSTHDTAVTWLASSGVTSGCSVDRYCTQTAVSRAQMATFLWRRAGSPAPSAQASFADVPASHPHRSAIAWLVGEGITQGVTATRFAPQAPVTRAQMATFLWRQSGSPAPRAGHVTFADVPPDSPHATAVAWLADSAVTTGCARNRFCGSEPVTRAQMATFLWRLSGSPAPQG